jgi:hypothetical protein
MMLLPIDDFIDRVKTLPQNKARAQVRAYLLAFVGDEKKGDILRNRYKREMRAKAANQ